MDQTQPTTPPNTPSTPAPAAESTARMFDHDSGQWVEVPAHQVDQAIASQRYTFNQGLQIPVIDKDGNLASMPSENAYQEVTAGNARFATPDLQRAAVQKERQDNDAAVYGNAPVTAAIAGLARGSTLGLSDAALGVNPDLATSLKKTREQNEAASLAGEIGSAFIPGNPLGAVGEAVSAAGKAAGATGTLAKAGTQVLRGMAEGATAGVGQTVTENALGNPSDVVDNLAANVGRGALFGGSLGGILGASEVTAPYVGKLVDKATNGADGLVSKVSAAYAKNRIASAVSKAGGSAEDAAAVSGLAQDPEFMNLVKDVGSKQASQIIDDAKPVVDRANAFQKEMETDLHSQLASAADGVKQDVHQAITEAGGNLNTAAESAYKQSQAARNEFEALAKSYTKPVAGDIDEIFADQVDSLTSTGNKTDASLGRRLDSILSTQKVATEGDEYLLLHNLNTAVRDLGEDGLSELSPAARKTVEGIQKDARDALSQGQMGEAYSRLEQTQQAADVLGEASNRASSKLIKTELDGDSAFRSASGLNAPDESKMLRTLSDPKLRQSIQSTAAHFQDFIPDIERLNQGFKNVEDKLAFQSALAQKMEAISPNGQINGKTALEALEMLGKGATSRELVEKLTATQAALGAASSPAERVLAAKQVLGEKVDGLFNTIAKHEQNLALLERYGSATSPGFSLARAMMSGSLMRTVKGAVFGVRGTSVDGYLSGLANIQKASQRGSEILARGIKSAASGILSNKAGTVAQYAHQGMSIKDLRASYPKLVNALTQAPAATHPAASAIAPNLSQALDQHQEQVRQFIASKAPQDPFQTNALSFGKSTFVPSDHDLATFGRYLAAATNPMNVLTNIKNGNVLPEDIETLQTLNPGIYQKLQSSVLDLVSKDGDNLSYQQKIQLGTLFNVPTDYTMSPQFLQTMRQVNTSQPQPGQSNGKVGRPRSVKIDIEPNKTVATSAQQATYGLEDT